MANKTEDISAAATPPHHLEEPPLKELKGADIVLGFVYNDDAETRNVDPQMRRRINRKLGTHIAPMLIITTLLQALDKATLGYSSIFGIIADANLVGTEFAWLGSIFYFGYLGMQPFAAFLLQRFTPTKCLAVSVFFWGVLLFMHIVSHNWGSLMAVRFLLGSAEGIVTPAFILISSAWYPRSEQPIQMGLWYSSNGSCQVIGGLLAYGLGHISVPGFSSWKWLFIVTGGLSVIWSFVLFFFFPDSQLTARFLNEEEKRAAIEMVRGNNTGIHSSVFKREQLVEALTDVKAWALFGMALLTTTSNSITTFGNLVISNFGFTPLATSLLGMPGGAWEFCLIIGVPIFAWKIPNSRAWCIVVCTAISLTGSIIVFAAPFDNKAALLAGYYLIYSVFAGYIVLLSFAASNIAGHTKKVTVNAMVHIGYCVGNIIGPQFFLTDQKPRYRLGIGSCMVTEALLLVSIIVFRFYLKWQNQKRAAIRAALPEGSEPENVEFMDLTDKQNDQFVYVY